jgi:hypothetical protein
MRAVRVFLLLLLVAGIAVPSAADERYALIVSGVSGSEKFAESQKAWVEGLQTTLVKRLGFDADRVTVLSESGSTVANRDNVMKTFASLKPKLTADDTLLVVLIGHGTFDISSRLVFVNTTSSSFPFVQALAGRNRIVIAATDSAAQKYATVFPQYFIEALDQGAKADNDKNGRLSVWEVFTYAGQAVKQDFDQKGTLVTERSVIEDGTNGVLAKTTFLDPPPAATSANAATAALEKQRITLEAEIEQLKNRKGQMPAGQYEEEFERLAIELAKISAQIRSAK